MFYVTCTLLGFYTIKDLPATPPMLGGSGSLERLWDTFPLWGPKPAYFNVFYLASGGYHFESLFTQLTTARRPDFVEMTLHHASTISSIFFSYMIGQTQIGVLILVLHYVSDVFTAASRAVFDIKGRMKYLLYLGVLTSWIYTRLYVFFKVLLECWNCGYYTKDDIFGDISLQTRDNLLNGFLFFLVTLYQLHWFWFVKMIMFIHRVIVKNEFQDDDVESVEDKDKKD